VQGSQDLTGWELFVSSKSGVDPASLFFFNKKSMKIHLKTYQNIFGTALIFLGVAVIGLGLIYAYGIFSGRINLPMVFEDGSSISSNPQTLSITNPTIGKTTIGLPVNINQNVGRGGDVAIQYIFVLLMIMGGGKIAKLGVDLIKIFDSRPERGEK
jgi:hypothetical protein